MNSERLGKYVRSSESSQVLSRDLDKSVSLSIAIYREQPGSPKFVNSNKDCRRFPWPKTLFLISTDKLQCLKHFPISFPKRYPGQISFPPLQVQLHLPIRAAPCWPACRLGLNASFTPFLSKSHQAASQGAQLPWKALSFSSASF